MRENVWEILVVGKFSPVWDVFLVACISLQFWPPRVHLNHDGNNIDLDGGQFQATLKVPLLWKDDDHGHDYDDDEYDDHLPQCALVL